MRTFKEFTNLYSLSKTLRFELKPVGRTLEWINQKGLLNQDEILAEDYKIVKKIIDRYHREFIEQAFESAFQYKPKKTESSFKDSMEAFINSYSNIYYKKERSEKDKKQIEEISAKMRKEIVSCFKGAYSEEIKQKFSNLSKKELIKKDLLTFCEPSEKQVIEKFNDFTTYFTGFHENRKNMYSEEAKSTAISNRIVQENLPKFLDNLKIFKAIQDKQKKFNWKKLQSNLKLIDKSLKIEDFFLEEGFVLTFSQMGIDRYNLILGGKSLDSGEKIQGLNELINLYRQENQLDRKQVPNLKELYKQILSDTVKFSFVPENFISAKALLKSIQDFHKEVITSKIEIDGKGISFLRALSRTLKDIKGNELEMIYVSNDLGLTNISNFLFSDWSKIKSALRYYYDESIADTNDKVKQNKKYETGLEHWMKRDYYSIQELNLAIQLYSKHSEDDFKAVTIDSYFSKLTIKDENKSELNIIQNIETSYSELEPLLVGDYPKEKNLKTDKISIDKIKTYMDSIKTLQNFIKPLTPKKFHDEKDLGFYNELEIYIESLRSFNGLYNKVRNYLTGKEYSEEKFKLNFQNPVLLNGWPVDKEIDNSCIILRSEENYYLGILDKESKSKFQNEMPKIKSGEATIEKMFYNQAADMSKDIQNLMVIENNTVRKTGRKDDDGVNRRLEEDKNMYLPKEINKIRKAKTYSISEPNFKRSDLDKFIEYYKQRAIEYFDTFKFSFKKTSEYTDFKNFSDHLDTQAYQINFNRISKSHIDNLVDEGKLYLFQIYNKDFSQNKKKTGRPNLHTIYFKTLFNKENLKDVVVKLNGQAEVFYRKKSINYSRKELEEGHHRKELKNKFKYPILKDKRYSEDKFHFHFPITLNFKSGEMMQFNLKVNKFLKKNKDIKIIGIDRGERHLLYISLIDQNGKIHQQESLNLIQNDKKFKAVNYKEKLQNKEVERDAARKSWGTVENIKELKEGYLSQVVHKISKMMVEHNAIVVMEDLNFGFKRGRQKVERQVYQKFEKMLIEKLNFLVFKDKKDNEAGGILKAYQLTDEFVSFEKMGKQSGFLFYVPAWNTSKIDPKTGFVNFLHINYENVTQAKELLKKFDSIRYNKKKDWFEFHVNTDHFFSKENAPESRIWIVCSTNVNRYHISKTANSSITTHEINVNLKLKELLKEFRYEDEKELKDKILELDTKDFYFKFISYLKILTNLRQNNGKKGEEEKDFILSPVANSQGKFFNSLDGKSDEPIDSDANGAYHIALKGLMNLQTLNETNEEDLGRPVWKVKNKDWLNFVWSRNLS